MHVGKPPFQALIDAHSADVLRFLRSAAGPAEAEDCYQETFLSALRAYPRLRDTSNLHGWLLTIAARKAIDAHRARTRDPQPVAVVPEAGAEAAPPSDGSVWTAVRTLPSKQRAAIVFRYVSDLAYADIGSALGCSEEAARRSVFEGLKGLRERTTEEALR